MSVLDMQPMERSKASLSVSRLGVVRFLNARPIVAGLDALAGLSVRPAPPSDLIGLVSERAVDLALCSSVDLLTAPFDVAWLPVAPLGCDGETLTVRVFSRKPLDQVGRIHCDTDSHTSIALLRVLLAEYWKCDPELVPLGSDDDVEATLLIGDKVIGPTGDPAAWPCQVDLGEIWKQHTGLPFVFAVWMGRAEERDRIRRVGRVLDRQLRLNQHRLREIVSKEAGDHGWSRDAARDYLTRHIRYAFTDREREGLQTFLGRCVALGIVPPRDLPEPLTL
ncbi:MAG: menaquinone biosynthesis protein [Phycisphaerales bacterium]|jgi:chorismate dehydratase|nr:menaquinone biosynthesis protein [Phycisphaerales bacterium]